jgi:pimeloyl-ACP methyl ester carboxylesterase
MRLAATEWGEACAEDTIVLLHGMLSSADYWTDVATKISHRRIVAFDLLGFGSSPRPRSSEYSYEDHCRAIIASLDASGVRGPVTLVGHSMGALIALRLAAERPDLVRNLVLIGTPIYKSVSDARAVLGRSWIRRRLIYGVTSQLFCSIWCQALRPISRRLAPLYVRGMPAMVARATVEHSWRSYSRSLANIVEAQSVACDLERVGCPTLIIYGDEDVDARLPEDLALPVHVRTLTLKGGHQLPITGPGEIAELVESLPREQTSQWYRLP